MKRVYFESVINREKFYCSNLKDVRTIDGEEYLRVFRLGTQHDVLIKKNSLVKIPESKIK